MKETLFIFIVLILADVFGKFDDYPPWILMPGANGTLQLAILDGPTPKIQYKPTEVTFHLFTRKYPDISKQINIGNLGDFDGKKTTFFIVHGFTQSGFETFITEMTFNLLQKYDSNIISVDWNRPAQGPFYNQARRNAKLTGETLAKFINYLIEKVGAKTSDMTCIGFSLGAHTCGFAGKMLYGTKLGRITGLDPAKPFYHYDEPEERLHVDDAAFVDIIHTSGGFLSFTEALGHADFYPNNGRSSQPGCGLDITGSCSHRRSYTYYIESIISSNFKSMKCSSWNDFRSGNCKQNEMVSMGFNCPNRTIGAYYLRTSQHSPYALG